MVWMPATSPERGVGRDVRRVRRLSVMMIVLVIVRMRMNRAKV